jgi:hypothetical protein
MRIRSAQPVTVADGWKGRRGVSIRKRSGDGLPASECGAPAARAIRTAWPAHAGGAARRAGTVSRSDGGRLRVGIPAAVTVFHGPRIWGPRGERGFRTAVAYSRGGRRAAVRKAR